MISEDQFNHIKKLSENYPFQSFHYLGYEHCEHAEIITLEYSIILLDRTQEPQLVFWAVPSVQALINALSAIPGPLQINFVPSEFVEPLETSGFRILGEFVDYFNNDLQQTVQDIRSEHETIKMTSKDAEKVSALSIRCNNQSRGFRGESPEWFRKWNDENDVLIIKRDEEIVGFCCVGIYDDGEILWIREIAVAPEHQGVGFARKLMQDALQYGIEKGATRGFLAVDIENQRAISLYQKFGFFREGSESEIQMVR